MMIIIIITALSPKRTRPDGRSTESFYRCFHRGWFAIKISIITIVIVIVIIIIILIIIAIIIIILTLSPILFESEDASLLYVPNFFHQELLARA